MRTIIISLLVALFLLAESELLAQRITTHQIVPAQELHQVQQITPVHQVSPVRSLLNHLEYNASNMEEVIRRHTDSLLHSYSLYSIDSSTLQDIWHRVPTELSLSIPIKSGQNEIVDMLSRTVLSTETNHENVTHHFSIDISGLTPGVYVTEYVSHSGERKMKPFMVIR